MPSSFESSLKSLMVGIGHLIEKIIGEAQKAKVSVGGRSGLKPILSLESQFLPAKVSQIITVAIERVCTPLIPNLKGQVAVEIGEGPHLFLSRFIGQQARVPVGCEIKSSPVSRQGDSSRGYLVRGVPASLPFDKDFFEYVVARLATHLQGDIIRAIKEIGRVTSPGGQGFLVDFHPFGLYAKSGGDRLRPVESTIRGIEDYYKVFRSAGLRIVDIRESFIDESFRNLFEGEEIQSYRNVKGTPMVIFIFFFKPRTKQE
jgi:SAM-dependent methyltransferase